MENLIPALQVALKDQVKFAILFGSALTKYFNQESDIDLAVYLGRPSKMIDQLDFQQRMNKTLDYRYELDIVLLDCADPIIAMQALANGKLIVCEDRKAFVDYKTKMISQYLDFKMDRKIIEEKIAEGSVYA